MRDTGRSRLVLGVLLLVSMVLITLDWQGARSPLAPVRAAVGEVVGGAERAAAVVVRPVQAALGAVSSLRRDDRRVAALERENDALRLELRASADARRRAGELDALLRSASLRRYRIVPARVVAAGPLQSLAATIAIDAGKVDGIEADQTVINGQGLVGRVTAVSPTSASVLLAVDPLSSVGVRGARTGEVGLAHGRGIGEALDVEWLDPHAAVRAGDAVVTRGGAVFVPGVPMGEVTATGTAVGALTGGATVAPYVDFSALDLVGVVVEAPRRTPRDAVRPPKRSE